VHVQLLLLFSLHFRPQTAAAAAAAAALFLARPCANKQSMITPSVRSKVAAAVEDTLLLQLPACICITMCTAQITSHYDGPCQTNGQPPGS
jgi:hypothetical protein